MPGFEKAMLKTGEPRGEYITRRLQEGAADKDILSEINHPDMYTGAPGTSWTLPVVSAVRRKLAGVSQTRRAPEAAPLSQTAALAAASATVPPEYEGILTPEDIVAVQAEAQQKVTAKQREQARKDMLAKAVSEIERQQRLLAQMGDAKGDMVDITLDLAPYTPGVTIDGRFYAHGQVHRVGRKTGQVLLEQVQRSWQHHEGLQGKSENMFRKPRLATINGSTGAVSGIGGLRA